MENENTKKSKSIIIAIVAVIIVIVAVVAIFMGVKASKDKKAETNQKESSYHETQISEFGKACASGEKMEEFVRKNVNLRAYYAMQNSEEVSDFEEEYKNAKSEDYESEEFIQEVVTTFKDYAEGETEINIKDIEGLEDIKEDDSLVGSLLSSIDGIKTAKFNMESEGVQIGAYGYFYDEKVFMIVPDFASIGTDFQENE